MQAPRCEQRYSAAQLPAAPTWVRVRVGVGVRVRVRARARARARARD